MDKFTTLDVIRYYEYFKEYANKNKLIDIYQCFFIQVESKIPSNSVRLEIKRFHDLFRYSSSNMKFDSTWLENNKPSFDIQKSDWNDEELKWFYEKILKDLEIPKNIKFNLFISSPNKSSIQHPSELFYIFIYILKQKFFDDENLSLIADDLMKLIVYGIFYH